MNSIPEKVVIQKVNDIQKDLYCALEILGDINFKDEDIIAIKPNLCDFRPSWEGGTTDPKIVEALICYIRENANPKIVIVESNHAIADADVEFERMGYKDLANKLNVELVNLSSDTIFEVALDGHYFKTLEAPETLLKSTKFISVAKLKTHAQQKITCNMKNYFGLIPRKVKSPYHPFMSEVLADLNEFYKPCLCVIDGIVGMEGFGPSDGDKKECGIIIAGTNAVATDAVAAKIMGFDPDKVPNLKYVWKEKKNSFDKIEVITNLDLEQSEKFEFIPVYSYLAYRMGFIFQRLQINISNSLKNFSTFISQTSVGYIVLTKGYIFIPEFGMLFRKDAKRFLKGIVSKYYIKFILWVEV